MTTQTIAIIILAAIASTFFVFLLLIGIGTIIGNIQAKIESKDIRKKMVYQLKAMELDLKDLKKLMNGGPYLCKDDRRIIAENAIRHYSDKVMEIMEV